MDQRRLRFGDYMALWFSLGGGLLAVATGGLLSLPLGLWGALLAAAIGTVMAAGIVAFVGLLGSRTGLPSAALLRTPLGAVGAALAAILDALRLLGIAAFEIWIIAHAVDAIAQKTLGFSSMAVWILAAGALCAALALVGPLPAISGWLKKVVVWVVIGASLWLAVNLLTRYDFSVLAAIRGQGGLPFWAGVDQAILLSLAWLPIAADYSRFSHDEDGAFWGTFLGYLLGTMWFALLGAILVMSSALGQEQLTTTGAALAASSVAGGLAASMLAFTSGSARSFAAAYSANVATEQLSPQIRQRGAAAGFVVAATALAAALDMGSLYSLLLLASAAFVPLIAVLAADYLFLHKGAYAAEGQTIEDNHSNRRFLPALVAWLVGFALFNVTNPSLLWTLFLPHWGESFPAWLSSFGGSIPAFAAAFVVYGLLGRIKRA